MERGYLDALDYSFFKKKNPQTGAGVSTAGAENSPPDISDTGSAGENGRQNGADAASSGQESIADQADSPLPGFLKTARKGTKVLAGPFSIREGETAPPKRYTSGSMILAMENAGQLIEEEELREQIRGSGIGTSATRAEILKKLFNNDYLRLNKKTQVITPSRTGEMIFDTCSCALKPLLDPRLTASWELGLTQVADGKVSSDEYTRKLNSFITRRTNYIKVDGKDWKIVSYTDLPSAKYDKAWMLNRYEEKYKIFAIIGVLLSIVVTYLAIFLGYRLVALVYSLICMLLCLIMRKKLTELNRLKCAGYAMVPSFIVASIYILMPSGIVSAGGFTYAMIGSAILPIVIMLFAIPNME